jgi:hypothetical protein
VLRDRSLWELYAYSRPVDYVPCVFRFDSSSLGSSVSEVGLMGNFSGWGVVSNDNELRKM